MRAVSQNLQPPVKVAERWRFWTTPAAEVGLHFIGIKPLPVSRGLQPRAHIVPRGKFYTWPCFPHTQGNRFLRAPPALMGADDCRMLRNHSAVPVGDRPNRLQASFATAAGAARTPGTA